MRPRGHQEMTIIIRKAIEDHDAGRRSQGDEIATIVLLGVLAYRFQSQDLVLITVGAVMLGALALPLIEHTWLRNWPRYATLQNPDG